LGARLGGNDGRALGRLELKPRERRMGGVRYGAGAGARWRSRGLRSDKWGGAWAAIGARVGRPEGIIAFSI
jgi:hypothetical protein